MKKRNFFDKIASISVIIPAYNRAGLIGETLRSLLSQTISAKEVIVVDDGSTDGTAQAVERELLIFREQFSRNSKSNVQNPTLKILRQQNAGPGAARNRGLAEATGEFIHFFDSDDIASASKHEVQLRALLETGADIAYGPWVKGRFVENDRPRSDPGGISTAFHGARKQEEGLTTKYTKGHKKAEEVSTTAYTDKHGYQKNQHGNAQGTCAGAVGDPSAAGEYSSSKPIRDIRGSNFSLPRNFVPEGPVLQARGLPKGDLLRALLTNWSVVPHACLFRRSILEKAGGFPEDIWVGEDQLLFLRFLLAGAKVVHTPETMVFYRLGDDLGKLTATGAAQKRHARDWARFLVKANEELSSGECRVPSARRRVPAEMQRHGKIEPRITQINTDTQQGCAWASQAGAEFLNPSKSELERDCENTSPIPPANDPSASEKNSESVPIRDIRGSISESLASGRSTFDSSTPPAEWHGFRFRTYEAWRDLEKFFPAEESELKNKLQGIWKRNWFSGFRFQVSGFVLRKLGGLKLRVLGYRENSSFRCGKFSAFGGEFGVGTKK